MLLPDHSSGRSDVVFDDSSMGLIKNFGVGVIDEDTLMIKLENKDRMDNNS